MAELLQKVNTDHHSRFVTMFRNLEQGLNGHTSGAGHGFRRKAMEMLETMAFPTRRDENWKYTSVAPILKKEWTLAASSEDITELNTPGEGIRIVFRNGLLDAGQSTMEQLPEGLVITTITEALETEEKDKALRLLNEVLDNAENAFVPLNMAFATEGIYIRAAKNVQVGKDIHVVYHSDAADADLMVAPQKLIWAETGSKLRITETWTSKGIVLNNLVNSFYVGANAQLEHYKFQLEGEETYQINTTRALQERDSTFSNYNLDLGGALVRNNVAGIMLDSGITTNLYGAFLGNDRQHLDTQTFIDHAFPHCQSNELYKGILTDRARGVFNGKVIVRQDAQKTNAFQQNSNLVLSPTAVMDTKPQLEIFADDVRCSHGATIGQLDEQSVFYLRSRGISDSQARRMLQLAFLQEVMENVETEYLHDFASDLLEAAFEQTH